MLDPSLRPGAGQDHKHSANTMHTLVTQRQLRGLLTTVGPCHYIGFALVTDVPQRRIDLSASSEQEPSFGARLRQPRKAAGLTQEELAGRAGLVSIMQKWRYFGYIPSPTLDEYGFSGASRRSMGQMF